MRGQATRAPYVPSRSLDLEPLNPFPELSADTSDVNVRNRVSSTNNILNRGGNGKGGGRWRDNIIVLPIAMPAQQPQPYYVPYYVPQAPIVPAPSPQITQQAPASSMRTKDLLVALQARQAALAAPPQDQVLSTPLVLFLCILVLSAITAGVYYVRDSK